MSHTSLLVLLSAMLIAGTFALPMKSNDGTQQSRAGSSSETLFPEHDSVEEGEIVMLGDDENRTGMKWNNKGMQLTAQNGNVNGATCYDSRLATFINNGLSYYSHNMGQLANYILNQIKVAKYSGYWFVHAAMIGGQQQGLHWQSASNGDIFAPSSRHGCYYHDTQTYVVILRY